MCVASNEKCSGWSAAEDAITSVAKATPVGERAERHSTAVAYGQTRRELTARGCTGPAIAVAVCALYLIPFMTIMLPNTDQGTFLSGAVRLIHGQVFGREFAEVMGPATFYWLALFYKIFGISFRATRVCLMLSWIGTAIAVCLLCQRIGRGYRSLPLLLFVVVNFSSLNMCISHHLDSTCLALLAVLCLDAWYGKRRAYWLIGAGILAGLTTLDLQQKGILLLVAMLIWLWIADSQRRSARSPLCVVGGFATILGVASAYFAMHGALVDVIDANYIWPLRHYTAVNNVPYAWGTVGFNWRGGALNSPHTPGAFLVAAFLMIPFLYIAILPGMVILQVVKHCRQAACAEYWLYLLCGLAIWASELHRKDITHLAFGSPLLMILSIQLLTRCSGLWSQLSLIVLSASAGTLAVCNLLAVGTAHPVVTRVGSVRMLSGGEEIAAFNARVAAGEEVFVYPNCPSYYFLANTKNPTRISILVAGYNPPEEIEEVIGTLESRRVKHVLWNVKKESLPLVFPAMAHMRDDLVPLENYLRSRYTPVDEVNGFQILERKHERIVY